MAQFAQFQFMQTHRTVSKRLDLFLIHTKCATAFWGLVMNYRPNPLVPPSDSSALSNVHFVTDITLRVCFMLVGLERSVVNGSEITTGNTTIPILRADRPYRSLSTVRIPHFPTGEPFVEVSQANTKTLDGSFHADGSFVPAALFAENVLRELFEAPVYKLLVSRELIDPELIAKMRTWKHSGFHVYVGPSILQKEDAVRVGLYIVRAPASASRLQLTENGLLKYVAKGSVPNDRCDSLFEPAGQIFDSLEWIAKVTSHIPEKGAQLVHYYGAYSNAHRGKKAKSVASAVASLPHFAGAEESETEWVKLRRKSWAALIRIVYESDPLLCPECGTQMKIVSVIKDGAVIDKILAHLQYKFEPLPLAAARPPPDTPPQWDSFSTD